MPRRKAPPRKPLRAPQEPQGALALFDSVKAREEPWQARRAAAAASLAEINARRCAVCGCKDPAWGFGPPLVAKQVWGCWAHKDELDPRRLPSWLA